MYPRDPSLVFLTIVAFLILGEMAWRKARGRGYDLADAGGSLGVALGQVIAGAATGGIALTALSAAHAVSPWRYPVDDWRVWLAAFFVVEFAYYWQHRFSHTIRWFWATHSVHHSANQFALPAAFRLGWTGPLSGNWIFFLPLAFAGLPPVMIFTLLIANLRFQFFLHTEVVGRLPAPIELIFNTPSHHRVHHGSNPQYLDKNFGGVLIVFDRLFGTFEPERAPVRYGLTDPMTSANPFTIALREWGRMIRDVVGSRTFTQAARALFARPSPPSVETSDDPLQRGVPIDGLHGQVHGQAGKAGRPAKL